MKINLLSLSFMVVAISCIAQTTDKNDPSTTLWTGMKTFHDFTMTTLEGEEFDMSQLKGKKVLVVNTASKCGLTPQYAEMEELYKKYGGDTFVVLGFPANNFLKQEPGTDKEIAEFCTKNYGVTFQMFSKISVKGNDIHPLYSWLTEKELNGVEDAGVKWNFQKFMINEDGKWAGVVGPRKSPLDEEII
ncbi:MAG: glutathione peroxidase, partial [Bacteroidetes bacterium]|nr:glutathione peroxidase [Bacteroidota bacterium]